MIDFNSYINGLDLSRLNEYCFNHGQVTQYAKGDYFIKAGEESQYIGFVELGYFNYMVHNSSEQKDYITGFAFEVNSWVITQTVFLVKRQKWL